MINHRHRQLAAAQASEESHPRLAPRGRNDRPTATSAFFFASIRTMALKLISLRRIATALTAIVAVGAVLAGCGSSSSPVSSSGSTNSSSSGGPGTSGDEGSTSVSAAVVTTPSSTGACGTVPTVAFRDEAGVITKLGSSYQSAYNGVPDPILASAWSKWKAPAGKLKVGVALAAPINAQQVAIASTVNKGLKANPHVGKVIDLSSSLSDLTGQIQQIGQLIQQKVNLIVVQPVVGEAFTNMVAQAAKAGIPVVSIIEAIPSADAVNLVPNFFQDAAVEAAYIGKAIGGKGTVLGIHAVPALDLDKEMFAGYEAALKRCPGVKFETSLVGEFSPSVAQSQVQSYLASHPDPVAGTVQVGGMAPGIIGAFQQAGKPVPAMANYAPSAGSLSWWLAHKSTDKEIDGLYPPVLMASAAVSTINNMLAGHEPKINMLTRPSAEITSAELSQYAKPGLALADANFVQGPASSGLSAMYLAPLFN